MSLSSIPSPNPQSSAGVTRPGIPTAGPGDAQGQIPPRDHERHATDTSRYGSHATSTAATGVPQFESPDPSAMDTDPAPPSSDPAQAMTTLHFHDRSYASGDAAQPAPGAVLFDLAGQLDALRLRGPAGRTSSHAMEIAGVLQALALYAELLGQRGMADIVVETRHDAAALQRLTQPLQQLASLQLFPAGAVAAPQQQAPRLSALLKAQFAALVDARSGQAQELQVRSMWSLLQVGGLPTHDPLQRACAAYLERRGPLQAVANALQDAIDLEKQADPVPATPTQAAAQAAAAQATPRPAATALARPDVHHNLGVGLQELSAALTQGSGYCTEQIRGLAIWLDTLARSTPLGPELQTLQAACTACLATPDGTQRVALVRDVASLMRRCLAASTAHTSVTAAHAAGHPSGVGLTDQDVRALITAIPSQNAPTVRTLEAYQRCFAALQDNPSQGAAKLSEAAKTSFDIARRVRGALGTLCATSQDVVGDNTVQTMLGSADARAFRDAAHAKNFSSVADPELTPLVHAMAAEYRRQFAASGRSFVQAVRERDPALLPLIPPDHTLSGKLYVLLYGARCFMTQARAQALWQAVRGQAAQPLH